MSITQRSHVWMFRSWTSKQARSLEFALETVGWQNSSSYLNNLPTFLHLVLQSFLHEVKSIIETLSKCNLASLYDPSRETVSVLQSHCTTGLPKAKRQEIGKVGVTYPGFISSINEAHCILSNIVIFCPGEVSRQSNAVSRNFLGIVLSRFEVAIRPIYQTWL